MSFQHIRGDTFSELFNVEGAGPISIVKSQIRTRLGALVDEAEINIVTQDLMYEVKVQDTTKWPVAALLIDVEFTFQSGVIKSTPTMTINVKKDVTTHE